MRRVLLSAVIGLLATAVRVDAALMNITETVVASGSLDGTAFTDATIIIQVLVNTDDIIDVGDGSYQVQNLEATFSLNLAGGGGDSGTFNFPWATFVRQDDQIAGIRVGSPIGLPTDILDIQHPDFATYDLKRAIGPISGTPIINPNESFATSLGDLIISSATGDATFRANFVGSRVVPEPSTLALAGFGGLAIAAGTARRRRHA